METINNRATPYMKAEDIRHAGRLTEDQIADTPIEKWTGGCWAMEEKAFRDLVAFYACDLVSTSFRLMFLIVISRAQIVWYITLRVGCDRRVKQHYGIKE